MCIFQLEKNLLESALVEPRNAGIMCNHLMIIKKNHSDEEQPVILRDWLIDVQNW